MGGSSSKPVLPPILGVDPTKGTYSGDYVTQLAATNVAAQQTAYKAAQSAYSAASSWKIGAIVGGILALPLIVIIIYDLIARSVGWRTILLPGVSHFSNFREGLENQKCYGQPVDFSSGQFLTFDNVLNQARSTGVQTLNEMAKISGTTQNLEDAKTACSNNPQCKGIIYWNGKLLHPEWDDIPEIVKNIERDMGALKGYTPYAGDATITSIKSYDGPGGFTEAGSKLPAAGTLTFTPVKDCPAPAATPATPATQSVDTVVNTVGSPYSSTYTAPSSLSIPGPTGPTGPIGPYGTGSGMTGAAPPPPLLWEWWYGSGAMAGAVDGTGTTVVPAAYAPLSAVNQGAYGMQWWMYIKDWNYGYGKEKPILVRPDATNSAVMNPRIVLHPTDNSLRISVSIFPSDENGSVAEPAAAGHAGSTDDVFICEVPNIPLQSWFSVSLTVFERNLDVYLNGMLVKSCFMSGVPKPAVGDIQVTPEGGFSGMVCGLVTSNKMLNPSDALAFYSSDTSCRSISDKPTAAVNTTGYSVKFGVYDTVGRQVREYTF